MDLRYISFTLPPPRVIIGVCSDNKGVPESIMMERRMLQVFTRRCISILKEFVSLSKKQPILAEGYQAKCLSVDEKDKALILSCLPILSICYIVSEHFDIYPLLT